MGRLGSPEGRRKEVVVTREFVYWRKEGMEREMGKE